MLRKTYDWMMEKAESAHAAWALGLVSFIESSVFPIPPDIMLIPMVLANKAKAWFYASICTITSVLGGIAGYIIGYFFFETIGQPLFDFYGYGGKYDDFKGWFSEWGIWVVLMAGITPFPYKVITIASGFAKLDLTVFILSSIVARGIRFFAIAGLLYVFGDYIRSFIEKYFGILSVLFFILLIGGFVAIKYLI